MYLFEISVAAILNKSNFRAALLWVYIFPLYTSRMDRAWKSCKVNVDAVDT